MSSTEQVQLWRHENQLGKRLRRKEDPRFLTGSSHFVDDMKLPGMLYASVTRSPTAHASIKSIQIDEAKRQTGVKLVLTANDLSPNITMPVISPTANRNSIPRPVLAQTHVNYQGEAIAFVVADSRYIAEDVAELVQFEYSNLPAVYDVEKALDTSTPLVHDALKTNVVNHYVKSSGEVGKIFSEADRIVELKILNQRVAPAPMETRSALASFDSGTGILTLWLGTQSPFETRTVLAKILELDESKLRVIAPDVGGSFGAKLAVYPEDVLVCVASMQLRRPVKWIESRSESLATMTHGRGQLQQVRAAVLNDGTILGIDVKIIADAGAYPTEDAVDEPEWATFMISGAYELKCYRVEGFCVLTNKVPFDSYRGAGRAELTYLIERTVHRISTELGLPPSEVKLKNFIKKQKFPFTTISGANYDSGDYESAFKMALELSNYNKKILEQRGMRKSSSGLRLGIGLSSYVETSAWGPDGPETASITITRTGKVRVTVGTCPNGQGHETPFAQIVADELGLDIKDISVGYGDTSQIPFATQTSGSRSAAVGGSAVLISTRKLKEKMAIIAASRLNEDAHSLNFVDGKIFDAAFKKSIPLADVAEIAYHPLQIPEGMESGLYAFSVFAPKNRAYPFGTHVATVQVEEDTGLVKIIDYLTVDDCGRVLNPMLVEGQVHGGVMQGIGQALGEEIVYNEEGQLLTSSFLDYELPTSIDAIPIRSHRTETPSPSNPLGVKGIAESGATASTPAVVNAVEDALSDLAIHIDKMPLKPDYIKELIAEAKSRKSK